MAGGAAPAGPMNARPSTRSGCPAASRATAAPRDSDREHRPLGAGRVHHGQRVGGELVLGVAPGSGPVGLAVAAPVEGHHAAVAREVGDLRLPVARVDDRPGRQEQDGRLALAVDLVEDPDAVALDVARWSG